MADFIEDPIHKMEERVKGGKLKHKKIKIKTTVSKGLSKDVANIINDVISRIKRSKICKKARKDTNPAAGAHSPVADMKRKVSNEVRKDLELD